MNATDLLAELRPPPDETAPDDAVLERILLAGPEPPRRRRYRRPLAIAAATAVTAITAVALLPSGDAGPVGLQRAVAALAEPGVLLHFKVTTTYLPSGATQSSETWQTPDGRRARVIYDDRLETAYDQRARVHESYVPERDEVLVHTEPSTFKDRESPFGSIATAVGSSPTYAGDLPGLLTRALNGNDPKVRHVGVTTVRGVEVDHIRIDAEHQVVDAEPGASPSELRDAPLKTITARRDVYVRHDNALPVRVVDDLEAWGGMPQGPKSVSEFTEVQKLLLDASTERALRLADHPGARRTVEPPFDDSKAGG